MKPHFYAAALVAGALIVIAGMHSENRRAASSMRKADRRSGDPIAGGRRDRSAGENDFTSRLRRSGEIEVPVQRRSAVKNLFAEWCRSDSKTAFKAWVEMAEVMDPGDDAWLLREIRGRMGFDATFEMILEVQASPVREHFLETLASRLHETDDPEAGLRRFLNLPGDSTRDQVLPTALSSWSRVADFGTVVAWIDDPVKHFQAPEMARLERAATMRLLESHPLQAADWLMARATEVSLPEHLAHVAGTWAQFTPNAAGEWLSSLPPGPKNDLAIAAFSRAIARDDPQSAAIWAASIQERALRSEVLKSTIDSWARVDPVASAGFSATIGWEE